MLHTVLMKCVKDAFRCSPLPLAALLFLVGTGVCAARGLGIKAGAGRIHIALDLEQVYDTNPGYFPGDNAALAGDMFLGIRPGLRLSFPSENISFELSSDVGYDYYYGIDNAATSKLSAVSGEAYMRAGFNSEGQVSIFMVDAFSRSSDPRYTSLSGRFDRTDNEARAHLQFKPGGGALVLDLAYGFFVDWFDGTADYESEVLSSYGHRLYFSGKWKFLPKTAVTLDFDSDLRRYPNSYSWGGKNMDLNAIRATLGLLGQITPTIGLMLKAGYGDTLLSRREGYGGENFRSAIGQAEISYRTKATHIHAGYLRSFQPVVMFAYFGQDRLYASLRLQFAGRFTLSAEIGFDWLAYGAAIQPDMTAQGSRSDGLLGGGLSLEYHILDWIEIGLAYGVQARFSDWKQAEGQSSVEYNKHIFTLHIGLDY